MAARQVNFLIHFPIFSKALLPALNRPFFCKTHPADIYGRWGFADSFLKICKEPKTLFRDITLLLSHVVSLVNDPLRIDLFLIAPRPADH
jgi:hypothetical protein